MGIELISFFKSICNSFHEPIWCFLKHGSQCGGIQAVYVKIYSKDCEKLKYWEVLYSLFHYSAKIQSSESYDLSWMNYAGNASLYFF